MTRSSSRIKTSIRVDAAVWAQACALLHDSFSTKTAYGAMPELIESLLRVWIARESERRGVDAEALARAISRGGPT